jgi:hypothetical protein
VPLGIDEYNHHMNGVDTGDQLRSYNQYSRPIRRGGWQSIAWNFLLEVILVNSFLLQIWGEPEWKAFESQYQWRRHLSAQLIQRFGSSVQARQLARPRRMSDKRNDRIPWQEHSRRKRGSNSPCVACSSLPRLREALGQVPGNRGKRRYSRSGCYECNVSLCNSDNCWYYFHTQII